MSFYFSRLHLLQNAQAQEAQQHLRKVGEAYRDHVLLWGLFAKEDQSRDFLFRRYADRPQSYYVVSARPPQADGRIFAVETRDFDPTLEKGAWVRFDLRANPVVARKGPDGRSRRHDVLMDSRRNCDDKTQLSEVQHQAALKWLLARAGQWGLQPRAESILTSAYTQHQLRQKGREIRFSSLDYLGLAQVADPVALHRALTEGVGHSRAFGCGLLLVRREAM